MASGLTKKPGKESEFFISRLQYQTERFKNRPRNLLNGVLIGTIHGDWLESEELPSVFLLCTGKEHGVYLHDPGNESDDPVISIAGIVPLSVLSDCGPPIIGPLDVRSGHLSFPQGSSICGINIYQLSQKDESMCRQLASLLDLKDTKEQTYQALCFLDRKQVNWQVDGTEEFQARMNNMIMGQSVVVDGVTAPNVAWGLSCGNTGWILNEASARLAVRAPIQESIAHHPLKRMFYIGFEPDGFIWIRCTDEIAKYHLGGITNSFDDDKGENALQSWKAGDFETNRLTAHCWEQCAHLYQSLEILSFCYEVDSLAREAWEKALSRNDPRPDSLLKLYAAYRDRGLETGNQVDLALSRMDRLGVRNKLTKSQKQEEVSKALALRCGEHSLKELHDSLATLGITSALLKVYRGIVLEQADNAVEVWSADFERALFMEAEEELRASGDFTEDEIQAMAERQQDFLQLIKGPVLKGTADAYFSRGNSGRAAAAHLCALGEAWEQYERPEDLDPVSFLENLQEMDDDEDEANLTQIENLLQAFQSCANKWSKYAIFSATRAYLVKLENRWSRDEFIPERIEHYVKKLVQIAQSAANGFKPRIYLLGDSRLHNLLQRRLTNLMKTMVSHLPGQQRMDQQEQLHGIHATTRERICQELGSCLKDMEKLGEWDCKKESELAQDDYDWLERIMKRFPLDANHLPYAEENPEHASWVEDLENNATDRFDTGKSDSWTEVELDNELPQGHLPTDPVTFCGDSSACTDRGSRPVGDLFYGSVEQVLCEDRDDEDFDPEDFETVPSPYGDPEMWKRSRGSSIGFTEAEAKAGALTMKQTIVFDPAKPDPKRTSISTAVDDLCKAKIRPNSSSWASPEVLPEDSGPVCPVREEKQRQDWKYRRSGTTWEKAGWSGSFVSLVDLVLYHLHEAGILEKSRIHARRFKRAILKTQRVLSGSDDEISNHAAFGGAMGFGKSSLFVLIFGIWYGGVVCSQPRRLSCVSASDYMTFLRSTLLAARDEYGSPAFQTIPPVQVIMYDPHVGSKEELQERVKQGYGSIIFTTEHNLDIQAKNTFVIGDEIDQYASSDALETFLANARKGYRNVLVMSGTLNEVPEVSAFLKATEIFPGQLPQSQEDEVPGVTQTDENDPEWTPQIRDEKSISRKQFVKHVVDTIVNGKVQAGETMWAFIPRIRGQKTVQKQIHKACANAKRKGRVPYDGQNCTYLNQSNRRPFVVVECVHGQVSALKQKTRVKSDPNQIKVICITKVGESTITPDNLTWIYNFQQDGQQIFAPHHLASSVQIWAATASSNRQRRARGGRVKGLLTHYVPIKLPKNSRPIQPFYRDVTDLWSLLSKRDLTASQLLTSFPTQHLRRAYEIEQTAQHGNAIKVPGAGALGEALLSHVLDGPPEGRPGWLNMLRWTALFTEGNPLLPNLEGGEEDETTEEDESEYELQEAVQSAMERGFDAMPELWEFFDSRDIAGSHLITAATDRLGYWLLLPNTETYDYEVGTRDAGMDVFKYVVGQVFPLFASQISHDFFESDVLEKRSWRASSGTYKQGKWCPVFGSTASGETGGSWNQANSVALMRRTRDDTIGSDLILPATFKGPRPRPKGMEGFPLDGFNRLSETTMSHTPTPHGVVAYITVGTPEIRTHKAIQCESWFQDLECENLHNEYPRVWDALEKERFGEQRKEVITRGTDQASDVSAQQLNFNTRVSFDPRMLRCQARLLADAKRKEKNGELSEEGKKALKYVEGYLEKKFHLPLPVRQELMAKLGAGWFYGDDDLLRALCASVSGYVLIREGFMHYSYAMAKTHDVFERSEAQSRMGQESLQNTIESCSTNFEERVAMAREGEVLFAAEFTEDTFVATGDGAFSYGSFLKPSFVLRLFETAFGSTRVTEEGVSPLGRYFDLQNEVSHIARRPRNRLTQWFAGLVEPELRVLRALYPGESPVPRNVRGQLKHYLNGGVRSEIYRITRSTQVTLNMADSDHRRLLATAQWAYPPRRGRGAPQSLYNGLHEASDLSPEDLEAAFNGVFSNSNYRTDRTRCPQWDMRRCHVAPHLKNSSDDWWKGNDPEEDEENASEEEAEEPSENAE